MFIFNYNFVHLKVHRGFSLDIVVKISFALLERVSSDNFL